MGGMQGLDYTAVKTVLDIQGIEDKKQIFADVRLIEKGALQELKDNDK